jgi:hypothetical protein
MEGKPKYLYLVLKEHNGEYQYFHKNVHILPNSRAVTIKSYSENYLKGFYGGKIFKEDDGYFFHGGEVFVSIYSSKMISEEEYNLLRNFL